MTLENEIAGLHQYVVKHKKSLLHTITQLKKLKPYDVDELFQTQHEQVFREIDCLKCANCCKTTPALLSHDDINRISRHLQLSQKEFIINYTRKDEDGDIVLNKTPCTFLNSDNTCSIYAVRPYACKDYPHTNRKRMHQVLDLAVKNAEICPAVVRILENIKSSIE